MTDRPADDRRFEVVSSEQVFQGYAFSVRVDQVRMPEGSIVQRDVVAHLGAVAVLAIDDQDQVTMVRQYRHPVGHDLLELPAGLLDVEGEQALASAKRELYEEASLTASDWQVLIDLHTSPGMTDEAIRVYLARGLTEVAERDRYAAEHEELVMTVEKHPLTGLVQMALDGRLTNGPAVAAVLAAQAARAAGWAGLRPVGAPWPGRPDRVAGTAS